MMGPEMARGHKKLGAKSVESLKTPGRHSDGDGLYLAISDDGTTLRRRWTFLYRTRRALGLPGQPGTPGRAREMGLGNYPSVSLAKARELAAQCRADLADGRDPIEAREGRRNAQRARPTFGECADELVDAKEAGWRNAKHRYQWRQTLTQFAAPLRSLPVDKVSTEDVLGVLKPIWLTKAETASRLRGRIEQVLDAAKAMGHIPPGTENPARWRGHLDKLLARRQKLQRGHLPAIPFADVPAFVVKLREREAEAALALEVTILTAARSGETLGAKWSEFDREKKVWTVPASRMKRGVEHRVPLSDRAMEILEKLWQVRRGELVFPSHRDDRPLSDMAMTMLLRRMKFDGITVHGFRSSFRDWAGEATSFPREVAEAALAHAVGDETERAYRRGDALEKRRKLMEAWANYCGRGPAANVIQPTFGQGAR